MVRLVQVALADRLSLTERDALGSGHLKGTTDPQTARLAR